VVLKTVRAFCWLLALLAGVPFCAQAQPVTNKVAPPRTLAELRSRLAEHVSQKKFKPGTFGVKIVSAKTGLVVFENDADELLSPASNAKLYTVAMALDRLGQDYRIRTSLYSTAKPEQGVLRGDLVVFGRGDPCINAKLNKGDVLNALQPLVASLTNAGVREVAGDLVADDSFFTGWEFGSGWTWDDLQYYYGAEVSALTIQDNIYEVAVRPGGAEGEPCTVKVSPESSLLSVSNRTKTVSADSKSTINFYRPLEGNVLYVTGQLPLKGSASEEVPVRRPAALFVELFRRALEKSGVVIKGQNRVAGWMDLDCNRNRISELVEIGGMDSLPLKDIAREVQKPSQNLYTDLLLAHVGEKSRAKADSNTYSEDLGVRELRKFLKEAGVKDGDVQFEEGSGLSRNNLTTPNATIALLEHMSAHTASEAYWSALPVAGVDGTLRSRMKGTAAEGNIRAKTGTLRWAYSLSGDVRTAAGERLLFSIMLNRYYNTDSQRSTRSEVDVIPVMLAEFTGKVDDASGD
jgi:D-alanyl-D-alanine carboxypeptidase/D-alanyl-D-alanine-endopeptidase (penicillin-binding protein 4)